MDRLDRLPSDNLLVIADNVTNREDKINLAQVCKTWYHIMLPRIYRESLITIRDEISLLELASPLNRSKIPCFITAYGKPGYVDPLKYARELVFTAPIHEQLYERCSSMFPADIQIHGTALGYWGDYVEEILARLEPDTLEKLSWHVGICIPSSIFGRDSLVSLSQRRLKHLSLVSDGTCPLVALARSLGQISSLEGLPSLTTLSWKGLDLEVDHENLRAVLWASRQSLVTLDLHFLTLPPPTGQRRANAFVVNIIEDTDVSYLRFMSLCHLSLSQVSFLRGCNRFTRAFPWARLISLKLIHCHGVGKFLNHLYNQRRKPRKLQTLEIVFDGLAQPEENDPVHSLVVLLSRLPPLKYLYLSLQGVVAPLLEGITHHISTLRQLVHHEMYLRPIPGPGNLKNNLDFSLTSRYGRFDARIYHGLEAIGLCIQPASLREELESIPLRPKWRLLHFRISGSRHKYTDILDKMRSKLHDEISFIRHGYSILLGMDFDFGFPIPNVVDGENVDTRIRNTDPPDSLQPPVPDSGYVSANSIEPNSNTPGAVDNENGGDLWPRLRIALPEELILFAHWAFGPRGLQHLQILAYGDFSYGDRHRESQILFCRKEAPIPQRFINKEQELYLTLVHESRLSFRLLYANDDIFASMQDEMRCLEACPTENLLNYPLRRIWPRVDSFRCEK